jgi:predicted transcriptional regulator
MFGKPNQWSGKNWERPVAEESANIIDLSAEIVAAFVANNTVSVTELPGLISSVHHALTAAAVGKTEEPAPELKPAVPVKKSVTPDAIICLEDGKAFKSLKRHLRTKYGLSPDDYRAKWGLPADYPMVAPNYAAARSTLAKNMGLGQQRRKRGAAPAPVAAPAKKRAKAKA